MSFIFLSVLAHVEGVEGLGGTASVAEGALVVARLAVGLRLPVEDAAAVALGVVHHLVEEIGHGLLSLGRVVAQHACLDNHAGRAETLGERDDVVHHGIGL